MGTTTSVIPGRGIADIVRAAMREDIFEILQPDGTPIGSIMIFGMSGGNAPPGRPSNRKRKLGDHRGNGSISRRTRAGARSWRHRPRPRCLHVGRPRVSSCERRRNEALRPAHRTDECAEDSHERSGSRRGSLTRLHRPDPVQPGCTRRDPIVICVGTGSHIAGRRSRRALSSAPLAVVSSPVVVTVNGRPAEVLAAVGYPGAVDAYQVNFRIPEDVEKGNADVQLAVAWMLDTPVTILVQ